MKWSNLTRNKCPKCSKELGFNKDEEMIFCKDFNCGFQISQYRMERLNIQMNADALLEEEYDDIQENTDSMEEKLEILNNL